MSDSFGSLGSLPSAAGRSRLHRLAALEQRGFDLRRLPYSLRILLENLLRREDGRGRRAPRTSRRWPAGTPRRCPRERSPSCRRASCCRTSPACRRSSTSRRCATRWRAWAATPSASTRCSRSSWSSTTRCRSTSTARSAAFLINAELEFERNRERYAFLRWGQKAFRQLPGRAAGHRHRAPGEPRVPGARGDGRTRTASLGLPRHPGRHRLAHHDDQRPRRARLGRRRHRGRGGDARPAGVHADPAGGRLPAHAASCREGATATDLVLTRHPDAAQEGRGRQVRRVLRPGPRQPAARRPRHHRQHGARVRRHLRHLPGRRRERSTTCASPAARPSRSRWSRRTEGAGPVPRRDDAGGGLHPTRWSSTSARSSQSLAGPRRPQDRVRLARRQGQLRARARDAAGDTPPSRSRGRPRSAVGRARAARRSAPRSPSPTVDRRRRLTRTAIRQFRLRHGSVVIAAITSCTNTSNPSVMLAAGLLAKKAVERGLTRQALGEDQPRARLEGGHRLPARGRAHAVPRAARLPPRRLRLHHLHRQLRPAAAADLAKPSRSADLVAVVGALRQPQLRGPHQPRRARQLPGLAAAGGRLRARRPDRHRPRRPSRSARARTAQPVYLRDIWPTPARDRRDDAAARCARRCSAASTPTSSPATSAGTALDVPEGDTFAWDPASTYVRSRRTSTACRASRRRSTDIARRPRAGAARRLDHHRPHLAGRLDQGCRARPGKYLIEHGVPPKDFNSYGARRGNHEVMVRGTFANIRLRNRMVPEIEGGFTAPPAGGRADVDLRRRDALRSARACRSVVLAGKEYGTGSSRDWAAKGPAPARRARRDRRELRAHPPLATWSAWASCRWSSRRARRRASLGLTGREVFDDRRAWRRASRAASPAAKRSPCVPRDEGRPDRVPAPGCASTRRRRSSTTATAASCSTCCASCSRVELAP